jgi:hypothetical protein
MGGGNETVGVLGGSPIRSEFAARWLSGREGSTAAA